MNTSRWSITGMLLSAGMLAAAAGCAPWRPGQPSMSHRFPQAQAAPESSASENNGPTGPATAPAAVVRGQNAGYRARQPDTTTPGSDSHLRYPMPIHGASDPQGQTAVAAPSPAHQPPPSEPPYSGYPPPDGTAHQGSTGAITPPPSYGGFAPPYGAYAPPPYGGFAPPPQPGGFFGPGFPDSIAPAVPPPGEPLLEPGIPTPIDVFVEETQTGRFMFGVGINSEAGVTGQIVIDERNFDIRRVPTSFDDIVSGRAFRGAGQGFRLEAMPGSLVQRYLVSFTEPYFLDTPVSLNLSGFFYDRRFFDWDEQRLGGRVALGYRLTHDLSLSGAVRGESVGIRNPRVLGVPQLDEVVGKSDLFSGRVTLNHDTRDIPFAPTEGHLIELSYEQVFGTFDYPRGEVDYRKYFLMRERPDGSGRHTLAYSFRVGISGSQTPIFENYFAGGFSTLRGFDFRGASPVVGGVIVGGPFRALGSVEYLFPLTADDMVKGVVFVDYGTVEEKVQIKAENYRVAPGFGLRISIPALGPAPLALDLAVPIARADTDRIQNFSFFFGMGR